MTLEAANKILTDPANVAEMTGVEKALLALIKDLQVRVATPLLGDKLESSDRDPLPALKIAEEFISDELESRRDSFLPDPSEADSAYIQDAETALASVRRAIALCGGSR